jgi:hypothetical protein
MHGAPLSNTPFPSALAIQSGNASALRRIADTTIGLDPPEIRQAPSGLRTRSSHARQQERAIPRRLPHAAGNRGGEHAQLATLNRQRKSPVLAPKASLIISFVPRAGRLLAVATARTWLTSGAVEEIAVSGDPDVLSARLSAQQMEFPTSAAAGHISSSDRNGRDCREVPVAPYRRENAGAAHAAPASWR